MLGHIPIGEIMKFPVGRPCQRAKSSSFQYALQELRFIISETLS
jgi:hypothetical protein